MVAAAVLCVIRRGGVGLEETICALYELAVADDLAAEIVVEGVDQALPVAGAVIFRPPLAEVLSRGVRRGAGEKAVEIVEVSRGGVVGGAPPPLPDASEVEAAKGICFSAGGGGGGVIEGSFGTGGATVSDIALMRKTVGPTMGVKASGGVHHKDEVEALVSAGATRIGCSASVQCMEEDK